MILKLYELFKKKIHNLDISRQYSHEQINLDDISIDDTSFSSSLGFNYCRDDNAVFTKYSLVVGITNKKGVVNS